MKKIESCLTGKKNNAAVCEDALFEGSDYVAVIDGVTSKGLHSWSGKTSGRRAAEIIMDTMPTLRGDLTAEEFFNALSEKLREAYEQEFQEDYLTERLRAAVIVYSVHAQEIWSYGDCQCLLHGKLYKHEKLVDYMNAMLRRFVIEYCQRMDREKLRDGRDPGREAIMPFLKMQCAFENGDSYYSYPILNGDPVRKAMIRIYPVKAGDEIVLASDGYPILCGTLKESERELTRVLESDPNALYECMGTKGITYGNISFDDRCYYRGIVE